MNYSEKSIYLSKKLNRSAELIHQESFKDRVLQLSIKTILELRSDFIVT